MEINNERYSSSIRSKQWIIDALLELMKSKSFSKISVLDICNQADITRPTFYNHFKTKEDVIGLYLDRRLQAFLDEVKSKGSISSQALVENFFYFFCEREYNFIKQLYDNNMMDLLFKHFSCFIYQVFNIAENFSIIPSTDKERIYHSVFLSNGLIGTMIFWYSQNKNDNIPDLISYVDNMFCLNNN